MRLRYLYQLQQKVGIFFYSISMQSESHDMKIDHIWTNDTVKYFLIRCFNLSFQPKNNYNNMSGEVFLEDSLR